MTKPVGGEWRKYWTHTIEGLYISSNVCHSLVLHQNLHNNHTYKIIEKHYITQLCENYIV